MTDKQPSEQELAAMLEAERKSRAEACWKEVLATLDKYNCALAAVAQLTPDGRIVAHPNISVR